MAGRPSIYSDELADAICAELSQGISLRKVCEADEMPDKATVFRWLRTNQQFCDQYARAKEEAADSLTDEMLDIADDASNDWMERNGEDSQGWQVNGEHIQRSRLRIDTRKWIASKLKPKKYGDRVTHSGDDDSPIAVVQRIELVDLDDQRTDSATS